MWHEGWGFIWVIFMWVVALFASWQQAVNYSFFSFVCLISQPTQLNCMLLLVIAWKVWINIESARTSLPWKIPVQSVFTKLMVTCRIKLFVSKLHWDTTAPNTQCQLISKSYCCRSEWAWSERARQLSNQQRISKRKELWLCASGRFRMRSGMP